MGVSFVHFHDGGVKVGLLRAPVAVLHRGLERLPKSVLSLPRQFIARHANHEVRRRLLSQKQQRPGLGSQPLFVLPVHLDHEQGQLPQRQGLAKQRVRTRHGTVAATAAQRRPVEEGVSEVLEAGDAALLDQTHGFGHQAPLLPHRALHASGQHLLVLGEERVIRVPKRVRHRLFFLFTRRDLLALAVLLVSLPCLTPRQVPARGVGRQRVLGKELQGGVGSAPVEVSRRRTLLGGGGGACRARLVEVEVEPFFQQRGRGQHHISGRRARTEPHATLERAVVEVGQTEVFAVLIHFGEHAVSVPARHERRVLLALLQAHPRLGEELVQLVASRGFPHGQAGGDIGGEVHGVVE
mmetsp:Transcript_46839/g.92677  ORF Transcript_46839/g.92677 Transcript_46839/m.92677 type:complete len:353 (-) Transcript_46839:123-1181(-)